MPSSTLKDLEGKYVCIHEVPCATNYLMCKQRRNDGEVRDVVLFRSGSNTICAVPLDRAHMTAFIRDLERLLEVH